jgi:hypothetical protein
MEEINLTGCGKNHSRVILSLHSGKRLCVMSGRRRETRAIAPSNAKDSRADVLQRSCRRYVILIPPRRDAILISGRRRISTFKFRWG